jgi:hypothetical protein
VYLIEPLGVVIPKSRQDIIRIVEICHKLRCPLTMRGGGTSQAGQAIGDGLQVDTSKYYNQILELNAGERWVRVQPGIVLDDLNAQLKPHGLRFAPDISTASRATVGGMMANNSSGARSVMYGKTIDHVIDQEVVLSDGSIVHFGAVGHKELESICRGASLEAECYRTVRRVAQLRADFRKCSGVWADTTWMNLHGRIHRSTWQSSWSGLRARSVWSSRRGSILCRCLGRRLWWPFISTTH